MEVSHEMFRKYDYYLSALRTLLYYNITLNNKYRSEEASKYKCQSSTTRHILLLTNLQISFFVAVHVKILRKGRRDWLI